MIPPPENMTGSSSPSKTQLTQVSPFFFIQLSQGDGKVHRNSQTAEAVRYHLADRKRRNRVVNSALLRDPSVKRISSGWQEFKEESSVAGSPPDSDLEGQHEDMQLTKPVSCSTQHLDRLLKVYVQKVVPIARAFSRKWKWCGDLDHIKAVPMLSYAAAAYASAFCMTFDRQEQNISGLWLDLETRSLCWLRRALKTGESREEWMPAMTLLMRLARLLGDAETADLHAQALQQMMISERSGSMDMEAERLFVGQGGRAEVARLLRTLTTRRQ